MGQIIVFPTPGRTAPAWTDDSVVGRVVALTNSPYWKDICDAAIRDSERRQVAAMQEP